MFEKSRSYDHFSVSGLSVPNGFDLQYRTINGRGGELRFRLPGTDEQTARRFDWTTGAIFAALYIAAFAYRPALWPKVFVIYLLFRCIDPLLEASYKSWHWAEHQSALWLEGAHRSFDKVDPVSTRCGSMLVLSTGTLLSAIVMVFWDYGVWALPVLVSASATWYGRKRQQEVPQMRSWVRRCVVAIAWPTAWFCLRMQRLLFLRRPSDAQRMHALSWARYTAYFIANDLLQVPQPLVIKLYSRGRRDA